MGSRQEPRAVGQSDACRFMVWELVRSADGKMALWCLGVQEDGERCRQAVGMLVEDGSSRTRSNIGILLHALLVWKRRGRSGWSQEKVIGFG